MARIPAGLLRVDGRRSGCSGRGPRAAAVRRGQGMRCLKVTARMRRQDLLRTQRPPLLWVVLDEAVIRRPVGGSAIMCDQLARVVEASKPPCVEVQVLPFAAGGHSAMGGSVTLLSFENAPDVA
ncbi:DUF5753 domain-containing protein [Streptomyces sp. NPDC005279]|uniref:DUF5753 domain-containing protein n=1 Tax=Streptomyces sp. NPDC005279 TaxID=3364712 RepID=UPI00368215E3